MRYIIKIVLTSLVLLTLSGCSVWDKRVTIYKVVKDGVVTFVDEETIKEMKLDKVNDFVVKVHEGNSATTSSEETK